MKRPITTVYSTTPAQLTAEELGLFNLFGGATPNTVLPLPSNCPIRQLRPGDVLARAGDACDALYLVFRGRLRAQNPASAVPDNS